MPEKKPSIPKTRKSMEKRNKDTLEEFRRKNQRGKVWKATLQKHIQERLAIVQRHLKSLEQAMQRSKEFDKSTALKPRPGIAFEKRMTVVRYAQKLAEVQEKLKHYLDVIKAKGFLSRLELKDYLGIERELEDFPLREMLQSAVLDKKENDRKVEIVLTKIREIREKTRDYLRRPDDRVVVAILEQCAVLIKMGRLRTAINSVMDLAREISNLNYPEFKKLLLFRIHDFFRWVVTTTKQEERTEFVRRYAGEVEKYLKQAGATDNEVLVRVIRPIRPF